MVYKTEIEWLRAQWMNLHGYARDAENDFALFAAPDLTAEEIRDCEFEDLDGLIEFVQPTEEGIINKIRSDLHSLGIPPGAAERLMSAGIRCGRCGALLQVEDCGEFGIYLACPHADHTETHTERRINQ